MIMHGQAKRQVAASAESARWFRMTGGLELGVVMFICNSGATQTVLIIHKCSTVRFTVELHLQLYYSEC